ALLERYSETYGVRFLLYGTDGRQMAGPPTVLPAEVADRMRRYGPGAARAPLPERPTSRPGSPLGAPPFLIVAGTPQRYWVGVRTLVPAPAADPVSLGRTGDNQEWWR